MPRMPDLPQWPVTTFESLSDDCLMLILDEAKDMRPDWTCNYRKSVAFALSLVSKRFRALCIPYIFNLDHFTIKLAGSEHELVARLEALHQSDLAGAAVKGLSVDFQQNKEAPGTGKPAEVLLSAMQLLDGLRELRVSNLQTLDRKTRATLRKATFGSVEILHLGRMPDAALFIDACPDLQTVRSEFPGPKQKATFQALADSSVENLELDNRKGWRTTQLTEIREYLATISNLCLRGEIKAKVSDLLACLPGLLNIKSFGISVDPWVNYSYYSRHYFDDRYLDAVDDAKDESPLNEAETNVFRNIFETFRSADTAWILPRFEAEQRGVVRNSDGTVASIVPHILRPSGGDYDFEYSPFDTVFPKWSMFSRN